MKNLVGYAAVLALVYCFAGCATTSHQVGAQVGLGKGIVTNQFGGHEKFERSASLAYQYNWRSLYAKAEAGGWLAYGEGRRHSLFTGVLGGVRIATTSGFWVQTGIGPAFISAPDQALSTHFQFDIEAAAGFQSCDAGIGFLYKHLSNAGIKLPNRGNDFVGIMVYWRTGVNRKICTQYGDV